MILRPEVKIILEKHINLIETDEWDTFFETIQEDWTPEIIAKVAETLESCNIHPLNNMTFIPEGYFYINTHLKDYVVPSNIKRICYKAFDSSDVETVHITGNVYDINQSAFADCDFLETVIISDGVKYIEDTCFYSCDSLEHVTLPKSLTRIGHNVFNSCDQLTEVTYTGTISEWNKVSNHEFLNEGSYISKIICSDGEINL